MEKLRYMSPIRIICTTLLQTKQCLVKVDFTGFPNFGVIAEAVYHKNDLCFRHDFNSGTVSVPWQSAGRFSYLQGLPVCAYLVWKIEIALTRKKDFPVLRFFAQNRWKHLEKSLCRISIRTRTYGFSASVMAITI